VAYILQLLSMHYGEMVNSVLTMAVMSRMDHYTMTNEVRVVKYYVYMWESQAFGPQQALHKTQVVMSFF